MDNGLILYTKGTTGSLYLKIKCILYILPKKTSGKGLSSSVAASEESFQLETCNVC